MTFFTSPSKASTRFCTMARHVASCTDSQAAPMWGLERQLTLSKPFCDRLTGGARDRTCRARGTGSESAAQTQKRPDQQRRSRCEPAHRQGSLVDDSASGGVIRMLEGFMSLSCSAPIIFSVAGVRGTWIVTMSDLARSSSMSVVLRT